MSATKFDFEYCRRLIDHMRAGKSYASFGAIIGVTLTTMDRWAKLIPEWDHAKELGYLCQLNKWEDIVIGQAEGDIKGNAATTIFALKNYFQNQFKENTALAGNGNVTVIIDTGVPRALEDVEGESKVIEMDENGNDVVKVPAKALTQTDLPDYVKSSGWGRSDIPDGADIPDEKSPPSEDELCSNEDL